MRIISGEARGRRLRAPRGQATRPTADRVREALFSLLGSADGRRVLDLFAGTGALALESLSRGAHSAVLVDQAEAAVRVIRANVAELGYGERVRVLRLEVLRALRRLGREGERFDWIFLDPPYGSPKGEAALRELARGAVLAPGALVIVEHDRRHPFAEEIDRLQLRDRRRWGQTEVSFYGMSRGEE